MTTGFCTRCGAVLRDGVCPHGHPQRSERRRPSRRRGRAVAFLVVLLLIATAGYLVLYWYPARAARDVVREPSTDYARALAAYRGVVAALPESGTDPEATIDAVDALLSRVDAARTALGDGQARLESQETRALPVISDRSPLEEALQVREQLRTFYTDALETVAVVETMAGYVSEITETLADIDDLERALGESDAGDLQSALASATTLAGRLVADLEAVTPPEELGAVHASLLAIAERIRADLADIEASGGETPVVQALLDDMQEEMNSYRETVAGSPAAGRASGLDVRIRALEDLIQRIGRGLNGLARVGVSGVTLPPA